MRRFGWVLAWGVIGMLVGCGGGGSSSLPEITGGHLLLGQATTVIANQSVLASGGTVMVKDPTDSVSGLTLIVPNGAYPAGTLVTVRRTPILGDTYSALVRPISPLITLENGGDRVASGMMTLTIPISVANGDSALVLAYHPMTQRLEVLSPLDATDTTVTVSLTACRPPVDVTTPSTGSGGINLLAVAVNAAQLPATVDSGFRPGVDSWQFPNDGSYVTPGGQCLGWSTTALDYFLARRSTPLYGRYDNTDGPGWSTPQLWQDDMRALRLAVAAQQAEDRAWTTYLAGLPSSTSVRSDTLNALACRYAMALNGEPQLFFLYDAGGRAHVLIVYRVSGATYQLADPAYPGDTTRAVTLGSSGNTSYDGYTEFHYVSRSTVIDWGKITELWQNFDAGSVPVAQLPVGTLQWRTDAGTWATITGPLTTQQANVTVRAVVPGVATPGWVAYSRAQQALDSAVVTATDGRAYPLNVGTNVLGFNTLVVQVRQVGWSWVAFQWVTVTRQAE